MAVTRFVPCGRLAVLKEAEPPAITALPKVAEPSRKVTLPVGIELPPRDVMVVVKVTFCPATACAGEPVRLVVVVVGPVELVSCSDATWMLMVDEEELESLLLPW